MPRRAAPIAAPPWSSWLPGIALAIGALCTSGGAPSAQGMCHAPTQGQPCGALSTQPPTEPTLNLGIGNPVHLATGQKFQQDIDLPAARQGNRPGLVRVYRSGDDAPGPWGVGWRSEYDVRLLRRAAGWRIVQADSSIIRFAADGNAEQLMHGRIHITPSGHDWQWLDGSRLRFDIQGRLSALTRPGQMPIRILRHTDGRLEGAIERIIQARASLVFSYAPTGRPRITQIDTPLGPLHYRYDPGADQDTARLLAVVRPDGMARHYLYEADRQSGHRQAITGVELVDRQGRRKRVRSWGYDEQGRVVLAIPGPPDQPQGRLDIQYADELGQAGLTRVLGTGGARTDLHHAVRGGRHVLMSVGGDGCPGCATPGTIAQYDARGLLTAVDSVRLRRDAAGRITEMQPHLPGWPGLVWSADRQKQDEAWFTPLTGTTQLSRDPQGRPAQIHHANGDQLHIDYDKIHRPIRLRASRPGQTPVQTELGWRGRHLVLIQHPTEIERLRHDPQGRLVERRIWRPHPSGELHYKETFAYDERGRMVLHRLPEGGALHYRWGPGSRLRGIRWEAPGGQQHTVIETRAGEAGYHYGNDLHLTSFASEDRNTDTLMVTEGTTLRWLARRHHDPAGRVMHQRDDMPGAAYQATQAYAYDEQNRLAGLRVTAAQGHQPATIRESWFAWQADGALRARRDHPATADAAAPIARDAAGLPTQWGARTLHYNAQRRLARLDHGTQILAQYIHNGRGHQIRRISGGQHTEVYYLDNRVVAHWLRPDPGTSAEAPTFGVSQRFIYAHDVPVGLIAKDTQGIARLYAVHADLLGAPRLVTDEQGRIRWLAHQAAGGHSTRLAGDLNLDLRLPGQFHDPATGWHDNIFRTYLPEALQYLEPDPLGPAPGQQALGYAAQQPMRHIDPLGLLLMAFDGTRNDRATQSNIWKLSQYYADGRAYYHAGPGNEAYLDWDALTAASASQILRTQWQSLLNALSSAQGSRQPVPIDILGYSRGAALARHFANQIAAHTRNGWFSIDDPLRGSIGLCVDLRFMGLFDSVAQFGLLGAQNAAYDLGITDAWRWVAHAVALHEYRLNFPLLAAAGAEHANTVEAPFIGAHADIGGGVRLNHTGHPEPSGDLSDVTLNWMLWQARAALVPFADLSAEDRQISEAWLHDERPALQRQLSGGDRAIQDEYGQAALMAQGRHPQLGDAQRQALEAYIRRMDDGHQGAENVVGEVNMQGYSQWLEATLGLPL